MCNLSPNTGPQQGKGGKARWHAAHPLPPILLENGIYVKGDSSRSHKTATLANSGLHAVIVSNLKKILREKFNITD